MWSECECDFAVHVFFLFTSTESFLLNSFYCVCGPEAQRNPEDALRAMARLSKFGLKAVAKCEGRRIGQQCKKRAVQFLQSSEGKTHA